ncbi:uncharacterized protein METZ01_LOCUS150903 [marine metagenome]|uniref:Uncharacterized protein n=1 Tax=marine metagenome TaxID=408172 RepID=A0A382A9H8_9ZZZZ
MKKIHFMNKDERNAKVAFQPLKINKNFKMGLPKEEIFFKRFVAATEKGLHEHLSKELGEDYGQALVDGDPEIDFNSIGKKINGTDLVYLDSKGEVLYAPPIIKESIIGPDGAEKERRKSENIPSNVDDELPVRWSDQKIPIQDVLKSFAFMRTIQIMHIDGLTYDFLYQMAKELSEEKCMAMIGAGKQGKNPLIFQANGSPYRGFLEGRVKDKKYKLLLHLSNMELKKIG